MRKNNSKNNFLDSLFLKKRKKIAKFNKSSSVLFSRGKRINKFFTEDSNLYISPYQAILLAQGLKLNRNIRGWDSLSARIVINYQRYAGSNSFLWKQWEKQIYYWHSKWKKEKTKWKNYLTPPRFWDATVIVAILLGMFSMSLIYKYLGSSSLANTRIDDYAINSEKEIRNISVKQNIDKHYQTQITHMILGVNDEKIDFSKNDNNDNVSENEFIDSIENYLQEQEKKKLEKKIRKMVKGYPIEKMLPYIMTKDRTTVAFLIGIAKKESNWGKRVPVLDGTDCYNYWGYRGKRRLMGSGGHTCFNSRKDAVDTVAQRIKYLSQKYSLNTPQKMVVWKCGNRCYKDNQKNVRKWISDVSLYFNELNYDN